MTVKIAGICFDIRQSELLSEEWKLFLSDLPNSESKKVEVLESIDAESDRVLSVFVCDEQTYCEKRSSGSLHEQNAGIYAGIFPALVQNGVIHLHASYVLYNGMAILFTGPSGIGKTTQAELWKEYQGATIVNADVVLIRKINGRYYAGSAPIHGSDPYCLNIEAPIAGIFALSRAEENSVSVMPKFGAVSYLLREIYRPEMSEETQDIMIHTVDDFMRSVPVYLLHCRADRGATQVVKDILTQDGDLG